MDNQNDSEYNALDKAWRDFVNYSVLSKEDKDIWNNKLLKIEGNNINIDSLHIFIKSNFTVEECDKIYKKAKQFLEKSEKEKKERDLKKQKEQEEYFKKKELEIASHEKEKLIEQAKQQNRIRLPENDRLVGKFASELGSILGDKNIFFFKVEEKVVVEIRKLKYHSEEDNNKEEEYIGFKAVEPERFVSLVENYVTPYKTMFGKFGSFLVDSSMNKNQASLVLKSQQFEQHIPKIKRIFSAPIPILYEGKLTFPNKGYDKRFESWLPYDSPNIKEDMSLEEAKNLLCEIYKEFCFEGKNDVINAFAGLLTPFLRGLYKQFNERTPLFFYIANRERAGKDYCAGITGLVHEGVAIEEPPVSTSDDSRIGHNEELRKKIMGVLMSGRKRMHFSNNKGFINNAVLEQIITNKTYSDRVLGRNEILTFDNELDISLSGNVGVTFTPDLAHRCRFVRLKLALEDPNSRKFNKPNLHEWVLNNRSDILSMLYTFVREWFDGGMISGSQPFTSFPEWARVCGGIMEYNGFGSPCITEKDVLVVGGDSETESMKKLYEFMYDQLKDKPIKKRDMIELIQEYELQSEGMFHYLDFLKNGDKTRFGMMIEKYVDRILSGIILTCVNKEISSRYREYVFKQYFEEEPNNNPNNLNNLLPITLFETDSNTKGGEGLIKGDKVDIKIIKQPYKTHLPCSKCGLKSVDGWEYIEGDKLICDICAGIL